MQTGIPYNQSLLRVRFVGIRLKARSIAIQELGETLVAIQQMINKTYVYKYQHLLEYRRLSKREQVRLSLQLSSRNIQSDGYGFSPFLPDPAIGEFLTKLIVEMLSGLSEYVMRRIRTRRTNKTETNDQIEEVVSPAHTEHPLPHQIFIGSIYVNVKTIASTVGKSGIEQIEFSTLESLNIPPIVFDESVQRYVRDLSEASILGEMQEITGFVTRLHTIENIVEVRIPKERTVRVRLRPVDFNKVRYEAPKDTLVKFTGRPILRFKTSMRFTDFEAYSVQFENESPISQFPKNSIQPRGG